MKYSFDKTLSGDFQTNLQNVKEAIAKAGFGIIFEHNMKTSFETKLNIDFRNYIMLGVCAPKVAYGLVSEDENIGIFLPCNIIVQEKSADETKLCIAIPTAIMQATENPKIFAGIQEAEANLKSILDLI